MTAATPDPAARPRIAFALSGGGAHGAAQVGMLQALFEAGITPDVLVGCSVGALNSVFVAANPSLAGLERLADIWRSLSRHEVFGSPRRRTLLNAIARRDHVYENTGLRGLIDRVCPVHDLADLDLETHVVTTDLDAARPVWWTRGPAHDILTASTCLPGVFAPVVLPGDNGPSRHVDGGVVVPIPVAHAASLDVDVVYVLDVARGTAPAPEHLNAVEVLLRSFSISRYANVPDPATLVRPGQEIVYLPSPETFGRDMRDFSNTARYIEESRESAAELLASRPPTPAQSTKNSWRQLWRRPAA